MSIFLGEHHTVTLTNEEKIFFPQQKEFPAITKKELINYYIKVAPLFLTYSQHKLATLQRFPDGIAGKSFYQKNIPAYFPSWIHRKLIAKKTPNKSSQADNYIIIDMPETLIYCINQGCITAHAWLSSAKNPLIPDQIIFDLDPGEKTGFQEVVRAALLIREFLNQDKLEAFVMTTGGKGVHVRVPLKPVYSFEQTKQYAQIIAKKIAVLHQNIMTTEIRKDKREGKLFIDIMRNSYGATAVIPYSVRPYKGAPIALPLFWDELANPHLTAQKYRLSAIFDQLKNRANLNDPWETMQKLKQQLPKY